MGIVPLLIFWIVEEQFGTFGGIVAAIAWCVLECSWEFFRHKRLSKITLISSGLIIGFGGIDLALESTAFFKFQPTVLEWGFALALVYSLFQKESFVVKMMRQMRPEAVDPNLPHYDVQMKVMRRMTISLIALLILHGVIMIFAALWGTTSQWIFWKTGGFLVMAGVWFGVDFWFIRRKIRSIGSKPR